ncbi:PREDICTED: probable membrane-associated kinase regulator 2 [Nelumbo nucifera]|uniref:Probable membrane-associated kinase regulator 2 n=1 Tax=Nelumbo nucifera TaxID=4432 RepID=A0A1U8B4F2_NELNU|nr:PREDICTED: probable membrane-associated kinase regulator 2 [Nelumbo nucifera]
MSYHKQGNLPAGLRVVCKHLGKSRLASSAVAAVQPVGFQARRCDDSLLQQQDGIQSAILHCKRSFNASRDSETSLLSQCASDPSHEMSICSSRNSS